MRTEGISNTALIAGGIGLYVVSTLVAAKAEEHKPTPPNRSRLSSHPVPVLASLMGAALAGYGLYRVKPAYGGAAVVGYFLSENFWVHRSPSPATRAGMMARRGGRGGDSSGSTYGHGEDEVKALDQDGKGPYGKIIDDHCMHWSAIPGLSDCMKKRFTFADGTVIYGITSAGRKHQEQLSPKQVAHMRHSLPPGKPVPFSDAASSPPSSSSAPDAGPPIATTGWW